MLVRPTNRPGNEATLDASWRIRDADSSYIYASAAARTHPLVASERSVF